MTSTDTEIQQAQRISLPSRIGLEIGSQIWETGWQPFPFLLDIERELVSAAMREDEQDWFILNAPNQIGKTSLSILFIFWYIGMFPDRQVIFISYSDSYSSEAGRLVRDLFKRFGEQMFGVTVDPDNDSQGDWSLEGHPSGGMLSVGIGGMITGRQGHLVWIDDILRTMEDATSSLMKEKHWKEWQGAIWGRRQPGSTYVVASTRLADDDLSGRLQAQQDSGGGIPWVRIIYPGIAEPPNDYQGDPDEYVDRIGRRPGDPLVTRFSKPSDTRENNWWVTARAQLKNPQLFDCMVQQNPKNSESGMFPADLWVKVPRADWPDRFVAARGWDLAESKGKGDYTCGVRASRSYDDMYYIDGRYRDQVGPNEGIRDMKITAQADGRATPILIEQEKGGAAKKLIAFYQKHLPGYMVIPMPADGSKEMRAKTYSILQNGGRIVLPDDEEDEVWVEAWIKTHALMMGDGRRPKHDDEVDAAAYVIRWLSENEASEWSDPDEVDVAHQLEMEMMLAEMGL